jgi:hypothetical protein
MLYSFWQFAENLYKTTIKLVFYPAEAPRQWGVGVIFQLNSQLVEFGNLPLQGFASAINFTARPISVCS